ncbi:hypothetical protein OF83DRAFT_1173387 [Amylostereum chailletii]|nr:hypothetical protein OF83DRAFT_1173387 [Amylostereum chailletii]
MFSFAKIATVAAVAFGTLASAMPAAYGTPASYGAVAAPPSTSASGSDVTSILTGLHASVEAKVDVLASVTLDNFSKDQITNVALDVKLDVSVAVDAIKALPTGTVGAGDLLVLLSGVISVVVSAFARIYVIAGVDQVAVRASVSVLADVLASLVTVVCAHLTGVLSVSVGLLVNLLGGCTSSIISLQLTALIKVLAL